MRLRTQIILASIAAGSFFTLMLCWMAYFTYPVPMPRISTFTAFLGVVMTFWWLVGSLVAGVIEKHVTRTVAAIRTKLENSVELRRRLEKQKSLLQEFSEDTLPIVLDLSEHAQTIAKQSTRLAQNTNSDESLERLARLADDCSDGLTRLAQHAHQGSAQAQLLQHDLAALEAQEPSLAAQLDQLGRLAQQCNLLALNAAIEHARAADRTRGVGLLTEEIKQLSTAAEALSMSVQAQANALREHAAQSLRSAVPLAEQVHVIAEESEHVRELHEEQCEVMDDMRRAVETMHDGEHPRSLRNQMLSSADALKSASSGLREALESTLKGLQVAA